jgi:UDP-N-acetyl-D-glucosamine dehydrogenase
VNFQNDPSSLDKTIQTAKLLKEAIESRTAVVGVIGMGYVGLPLAVTVARAGFCTIGFDTDEIKVRAVSTGKSYIEDLNSDDLDSLIATGALKATGDFGALAECNVILICVPTPLTTHREPDLSHVLAACQAVADNCADGVLVVLESTTYPETTAKVVGPQLQHSGRLLGRDIFLAYSPERADPGNTRFQCNAIPKIVAGDCKLSGDLVESFYGCAMARTVRVSSTKTAEAIKLTENIFRSVNIALVNELKPVFDAMNIDVWEVIDGAATKPFGYMPFYPGPGVGGHCIPVDPHYLLWKAREYDLAMRIIDVAGETNAAMPQRIVARLRELLDIRLGKALSQSRVLVAGVAYKKNIADIRCSPGIEILSLLEDAGAAVDYIDPHVPQLRSTHGHGRQVSRRSREASCTGDDFDAVVVATDHDAFDYRGLLGAGKVVVDTRNAFARRNLSAVHVVKV